MISQLAAAIAALTTANAELAKTNKLLTTDNKKLRNKLDGVPSSRSGRTFTKTNTGCFAVGVYCQYHRFCLGKTHTSATCSTPGPNHKKESTRANTMGGCQDHIGWDA